MVTADLRDRIADALERAIAEPAVSPPTARGIADELTDAVMGVVGPEISRLNARFHEESFKFLETIGDAQDLDAARRALSRVRLLHRRYRFAGDDTTDCCEHCNRGGNWVPYPCPTIRTIDGSTDE